MVEQGTENPRVGGSIPSPGTTPRLAGRSPRATVAQLVEQLTRNEQVSGSNPLGGSIVKPSPTLVWLLLNIFMRDCLYTAYLTCPYDLHYAEEYFEVPLDSISAKSLRKGAGRGVLPRWPGVRASVRRSVLNTSSSQASLPPIAALPRFIWMRTGGWRDSDSSSSGCSKAYC